MATEMLRAHNVILRHQDRIRAGHQKPASPAARKPAAAGRRHQGGGRKAARGPAAADVYAGPAFSTSPEPSSLPLPQFPVKKTAAVAFVDDAATRGLRRILRLE
ncbi:hypothetical protein PR202_ga22819 [Eleusine coracana subsp. coracana]|uniref:Uncharacterized protein n=1 Tax=Eleusine coracana subsp. coracana TaxID=191504 RepID=A0AAV5D4M1_ELECO|nr:hypothetical protein QOZ80_1AG0017610 [Eleusine coracana subsp. coracana]GJN05209.1 hypothetical protein PR202_ga22819 [Eleusine coracana subsp. coracana]